MRYSQYNIWVEHDTADFVFNGVSGGLLRVPRGQRKAIDDFVSGITSPDLDEALLEKLVVGRMVVHDDADEQMYLRRRYDTSRESLDQLSLTVVTSLGCNFDCPYCFEDKHASIITPQVQEAVVGYVTALLSQIRSLSVQWFGGEPLLARAQLFSLSSRLEELCDSSDVRFSASIITNGYLLDAATCQELQRHRVRHVQVTLDGPPAVHDRMRPLASGRGTFARIVDNLTRAKDFFPVSIRVNVDRTNASHLEHLLQILKDAGLQDCDIGLGKLSATDGEGSAPSATYGNAKCFRSPEFAELELAFTELAVKYGFPRRNLPTPTGTPCVAVRRHDLVIGSEGELYKCYDNVGDPGETIGNILQFSEPNGRLSKWLSYHPLDNKECSGCIALPVCMGGCAEQALAPATYENRCGTFRFNHVSRVRNYVLSAIGEQAFDESVFATLARDFQPSPAREMLPIVAVTHSSQRNGLSGNG